MLIKKRVTLLSILLVLVLPLLSYGYSGRTDSQGGHYNLKTGEYHYHRKKAPTSTPTTKQRQYQSAPIKRNEAWYQENWCGLMGGRTEVVLPDRTRCDCLTDSHAIEFDFGKKWAEAIGQSLYYSIQTGKQPGIVLILESEKDRKYWIRLNSVIDHFQLPIETWNVGDGSY